ncbi:hypothetical protein Mth01_17830 [Sphaerimonospora thailandensis]|uniref:Uncharacterized protein n=1 Tax=Sphaerimonospora thailandensis TaxID=795644 RepID=A0A8J3VYZ8_9ACTN|nr:hypothetical protein Mth01_17830 [Sphaerimonospora thailandensis]
MSFLDDFADLLQPVAQALIQSVNENHADPGVGGTESGRAQSDAVSRPQDHSPDVWRNRTTLIPQRALRRNPDGLAGTTSGKPGQGQAEKQREAAIAQDETFPPRILTSAASGNALHLEITGRAYRPAASGGT